MASLAWAQGEPPRNFAVPSFNAVVLMIIVIVIVCMPSRKQTGARRDEVD
jgi:hypothetical protein